MSVTLHNVLLNRLIVDISDVYRQIVFSVCDYIREASYIFMSYTDVSICFASDDLKSISQIHSDVEVIDLYIENLLSSIHQRGDFENIYLSRLLGQTIEADDFLGSDLYEIKNEIFFGNWLSFPFRSYIGLRSIQKFDGNVEGLDVYPSRPPYIIPPDLYCDDSDTIPDIDFQTACERDGKKTKEDLDREIEEQTSESQNKCEAMQTLCSQWYLDYIKVYSKKKKNFFSETSDNIDRKKWHIISAPLLRADQILRIAEMKSVSNCIRGQVPELKKRLTDTLSKLGYECSDQINTVDTSEFFQRHCLIETLDYIQHSFDTPTASQVTSKLHINQKSYINVRTAHGICPSDTTLNLMTWGMSYGTRGIIELGNELTSENKEHRSKLRKLKNVFLPLPYICDVDNYPFYFEAYSDHLKDYSKCICKLNKCFVTDHNCEEELEDPTCLKTLDHFENCKQGLCRSQNFNLNYKHRLQGWLQIRLDLLKIDLSDKITGMILSHTGIDHYLKSILHIIETGNWAASNSYFSFLYPKETLENELNYCATIVLSDTVSTSLSSIFSAQNRNIIDNFPITKLKTLLQNSELFFQLEKLIRRDILPKYGITDELLDFFLKLDWNAMTDFQKEKQFSRLLRETRRLISNDFDTVWASLIDLLLEPFTMTLNLGKRFINCLRSRYVLILDSGLRDILKNDYSLKKTESFPTQDDHLLISRLNHTAQEFKLTVKSVLKYEDDELTKQNVHRENWSDVEKPEKDFYPRRNSMPDVCNFLSTELIAPSLDDELFYPQKIITSRAISYIEGHDFTLKRIFSLNNQYILQMLKIFQYRFNFLRRNYDHTTQRILNMKNVIQSFFPFKSQSLECMAHIKKSYKMFFEFKSKTILKDSSLYQYQVIVSSMSTLLRDTQACTIDHIKSTLQLSDYRSWTILNFFLEYGKVKTFGWKGLDRVFQEHVKILNHHTKPTDNEYSYHFKKPISLNDSQELQTYFREWYYSFVILGNKDDLIHFKSLIINSAWFFKSKILSECHMDEPQSSEYYINSMRELFHSSTSRHEIAVSSLRYLGIILCVYSTCTEAGIKFQQDLLSQIPTIDTDFIHEMKLISPPPSSFDECEAQYHHSHDKKRTPKYINFNEFSEFNQFPWKTDNVPRTLDEINKEKMDRIEKQKQKRDDEREESKRQEEKKDETHRLIIIIVSVSSLSIFIVTLIILGWRWRLRKRRGNTLIDDEVLRGDSRIIGFFEED